MIKKHRTNDVRWLFDKFSVTAPDSKLKPHNEIVSDIKKTIETIEDIESKLNQPCFTGKPFDEFSKQEELLQVWTLEFVYPYFTSKGRTYTE